MSNPIEEIVVTAPPLTSPIVGSIPQDFAGLDLFEVFSLPADLFEQLAALGYGRYNPETGFWENPQESDEPIEEVLVTAPADEETGIPQDALDFIDDLLDQIKIVSIANYNPTTGTGFGVSVGNSPPKEVTQEIVEDVIRVLKKLKEKGTVGKLRHPLNILGQVVSGVLTYIEREELNLPPADVLITAVAYLADLGIEFHDDGLVVDSSLVIDSLEGDALIYDPSSGDYTYQPEGVPVQVNTGDQTITTEVSDEQIDIVIRGNPDLDEWTGTTVEEVPYVQYDIDYGLPPEPPGGPENPEPRPFGFPLPELDFEIDVDRDYDLHDSWWYRDAPLPPLVEFPSPQEIALPIPSQVHTLVENELIQPEPDPEAEGGINEDTATTLAETALDVATGNEMPVNITDLHPDLIEELPEEIPEFEIEPSLEPDPGKKRPQVKVRIKRRKNKYRKRDEENRLRKDRKKESSKLYMAALAFINRTYGSVTEVIDFYEVFAKNFYIIRDGKRIRFDRLTKDDLLWMEAQVLGNEEIDFFLDSKQMLLDGLAEIAIDKGIGKFKQWERKQFAEMIENGNILQLPSSIFNRIIKMYAQLGE